MTGVNPDRGEVLLDGGDLGPIVLRFTADRMRRLQAALSLPGIYGVMDAIRNVSADAIIKAVAIGSQGRDLGEEEVGASNLPLMPAATALATAFSWALFGTAEPPKPVEAASDRPLETSDSAT